MELDWFAECGPNIFIVLYVKLQLQLPIEPKKKKNESKQSPKELNENSLLILKVIHDRFQ